MSKFDLSNFSSQVKSAAKSTDTLDRETAAAAKSVRDMGTAVAAIGAMARSAAQVKTSVTSGSGTSGAGSGSGQGNSASASLGAAGQLAASIGPQMSAALTAGLAPLTTIAAKMQGQFSALGGTLTTFAQRIDAAMKIKSMDEFIEKIRDRVPKAMMKVVDGAQGVRKSLSTLSSMGNVAGGSLDKIGKNRFTAPIAGAAQLAGKLATVTPTVNRATGAVRNFGGQLLIALGAFGLAYKVVEFFKKGISGATNLAETLSKTKEVFGASTNVVTQQADKMANAFGLPKQEILDAASSFGLLAKGVGQTDAQAATLANQMAKLAADAASFYNVDNATALEKIQAGLTGESKPLKDFGILMNEDAVKLEALRLGLAKGTQALSENAKFQARASLITKGLATATGDLERTSGSAANQFRRAGGGLSNFATTVGGVLMPAVQAGIGSFNELLASLVETFEANRPMIESWATVVKEYIDGVGVVIRNFGALWEVLTLQIGAWGVNTVAVIGTLPDNFALIADYVGNNWHALLRDFDDSTNVAFANILTNAVNFGKALWAAFKGEGFDFQWTPLLEGFKATAEKFPDLIKPAFIDVQSQIDEVMNGVVEKEMKRSADMAKVVSGPAKPAAAEAAAGPSKFAGLAERDTKEAYSAIINHQSGGGGDPIKDVAKTAKETLAENKKQTAALTTIASKGGSGVEVFAAA